MAYGQSRLPWCSSGTRPELLDSLSPPSASAWPRQAFERSSLFPAFSSRSYCLPRLLPPGPSASGLSIGVAFYALSPLTLFLLGRKRAFWIASAVVLLVPVIRIAQFFVWPSHRLGICEEF